MCSMSVLDASFGERVDPLPTRDVPMCPAPACFLKFRVKTKLFGKVQKHVAAEGKGETKAEGRPVLPVPRR